jgi:hypothetical protein
MDTLQDVVLIKIVKRIAGNVIVLFIFVVGLKRINCKTKTENHEKKSTFPSCTGDLIGDDGPVEAGFP